MPADASSAADADPSGSMAADQTVAATRPDDAAGGRGEERRQLDPAHESARTLNAAAFDEHEIVQNYDARPDYPVQALRDAIYFTDHAMPLVIDAGAGTGKLTTALRAADPAARIAAVDHNDEMIAAYSRKHPGIPIYKAPFEKLPFPDRSVDAVFFGTSLHWGDPNRLPAELSRVLTPRGIVAHVASGVPSSTRLGGTFADSFPAQTQTVNPMTRHWMDLGPDFALISVRRYDEEVWMDVPRFDTYLRSISLFYTADAVTVQRAWGEMRRYAAETAVDGRVPVPTETLVRVARLKSSPRPAPPVR